uniref:Uncharacterized protein n=1 Tax=Fervidobacterium thailandense TaxID=1008305 RepID=A0A7C4GF27_9BACT
MLWAVAVDRTGIDRHISWERYPVNVSSYTGRKQLLFNEAVYFVLFYILTALARRSQLLILAGRYLYDKLVDLSDTFVPVPLASTDIVDYSKICRFSFSTLQC